MSLQKIADDLGLSKAAISLALNGRPGVAPATMERVRRHAHAIGYRPDPVHAELLTLVRRGRRRMSAHAIAFINPFANPRLFHQIIGFRLFFEGVREQANTYGYSVQLFEPAGDGIRPERLARILQARGIRGVIMGPRWESEPRFDFPYERFCCVQVGEVHSPAIMPAACNYHQETATRLLEHLVRRGYSRIGVALQRSFEAPHRFDYTAGVRQAQLILGEAIHLELLLYDDRRSVDWASWCNGSRLQAVVSLDPAVYEALCQSPLGSSGRLGYACLSVPEGSSLSGMDQNAKAVGAAAMDLLRTEMLRGKNDPGRGWFGLLLEAQWKEGITAPPYLVPA